MTDKKQINPLPNDKAQPYDIEFSGHDINHQTPSLVPLGVTIGLALFTLILSLAGYIFRVVAGDTLSEIFQHAIVLVPLFVIVIPVGMWIGAIILNTLKGMNIQRRNALTLGWLLSSVTLLWFMGTYS